jgi:hypothetical protein
MFDLKDGISNNMASAVPLRFVTKMEIQYGVRLSVMFYHKDGNANKWRPSFFMFDHKDGNSLWRPSVCYV